MARIRSIRPEIWTDETFVSLSFGARLLFFGASTHADDGGNLPASVRTLKMQVFPGDDLRESEVAAMVAELLGAGMFAQYAAEGRAYWHIQGWEDTQKIEKATYRHPKPADSPTARRILAESSPTARRPLNPGIGIGVGNGTGNGVGGDAQAPDPDPDVLAKNAVPTATEGGEDGLEAETPEYQVRSWCKTNLESLREWANQAGFDPEKHGKVRDEVVKFCAHYTDKAEVVRQKRFLDDPTGFFRRNFKAWLLDAVRYNAPKNQSASSGVTRKEVETHLQTAHRLPLTAFSDDEVERLCRAKNPAHLHEIAARLAKAVRGTGPARRAAAPQTLSTALQTL